MAQILAELAPLIMFEQQNTCKNEGQSEQNKDYSDCSYVGLKEVPAWKCCVWFTVLKKKEKTVNFVPEEL